MTKIIYIDGKFKYCHDWPEEPTWTGYKSDSDWARNNEWAQFADSATNYDFAKQASIASAVELEDQEAVRIAFCESINNPNTPATGSTYDLPEGFRVEIKAIECDYCIGKGEFENEDKIKNGIHQMIDCYHCNQTGKSRVAILLPSTPKEVTVSELTELALEAHNKYKSEKNEERVINPFGLLNITPKEETQEDLWRLALIHYNLEGADSVLEKFHLTRKP